MRSRFKIFILLVFVFAGAARALSMREETSNANDGIPYGNDGIDICFDTSQEVRKLTTEPNACKADSDCVGMQIACSMGCPVVNKETEVKVKELLAQRGKCMCTMEFCAAPEKHSCVDGFCKAEN